MKKLFIAIILSLILCTSALALNVEVEALSDFSTDSPPEVFSVRIIDSVDNILGNIEAGSVIEGKIITQDAKRLKRNATFSFIPITLITPEGNIFKAKKECIGKYKNENSCSLSIRDRIKAFYACASEKRIF